MAVGRHRINLATSNVHSELLDIDVADISAQVDLRYKTAILSGDIGSHLRVRRQTNDDQYGIRTEMGSDGAMRFQLYKFVGGVYTTLGGTPHTISGVTPTPNVWYTHKIEVFGSTIRGKVWITANGEPPAWQATATDTALTASGHLGIASTSTGANASQYFEYDNLLAESPEGTPEDPPPGEMPIGGDESLRGPKSYTLLTPNATVQAPYGLTQVHAARDAAGVNGVVRFPAFGGDYNLSPTMSVAGQTWQMETLTTKINGTVTLAAANLTFEGGIVRNFWTNRGPFALNFIIRNVQIRGTGTGVTVQGGHHNGKILNCSFFEQTQEFVNLYYDQAGDPNLQGFRMENCIGVKTAGVDRSGISGADGNNLRKIFDFVVRNCRFNFGAYDGPASGHFGIEVWNNETNAAGRGGIVEYCDLIGGDVLMSMVRSRDNWIHHNILRVTVGFAAYEVAGTNHLRGIMEYNTIIGPSSAAREVCYHNTGAKFFTIRQNTISDLARVVFDSDVNGGGYTIEDNCLTNVPLVIKSTGWGTANTVNRNGSNFGPCA